MSVKEIFAAFSFNKVVDIPYFGLSDPPLEWLQDRAKRARLDVSALPVQPGAPAGKLPELRTTWADLSAEIRIVDDEDTRAFVIVVSQTDFLRSLVRGDEENQPGNPAQRRLAEAFRDVCDGIEPHYAYFNPLPEESIREQVLDTSAEIYGFNSWRLAGLGFPLWYVDSTLDDANMRRRAQVIEDLRARTGTMVSRNGTSDDWF